jgi:cytochrome P450
MHSNKDVFGADAELYRPERWLESSELSSVMDRNFMAVGLHYHCIRYLCRIEYAHNISQFGGGARTCIGKNISLLEIGTLVPNLIRSFQFELADQNLEPECENVWFVKQKNILCRVRSLQVTSEFGKNEEVDGVLG